jgi:hypothetical protein
MRVSGMLGLVSVVSLTLVECALAQDRPSAENLIRMVAQLHWKRPIEVVFKRTNRAINPICGLSQYDLKLTRGLARHTFSVLSETDVTAPGPKSILASITRLRVDADGSARAYHPEDPNGRGVCELRADTNGHYYPRDQQVCAIDRFSDGNIQVFKGVTKISDPLLRDDWGRFWRLVRDRKLPSFDLAKEFRIDLGYHYYFFYWPQGDMSVFFIDENVPRTSTGYPCTRSEQSRFPGYFVSGTTLKHTHDNSEAEDVASNEVAPPECVALRNIDSETLNRPGFAGGSNS